MKYIHGNLLDLAESGKFSVIVHGANCFNVMGAGIAKQIKDRYPKAYLIDQCTEAGDMSKLGKFTQAYIDIHGKSYVSFTIINAYTQFGMLPRSKINADYDAITNVFKQIKLLYDMNPQAPCRIGIPKIGAGLAGGDWDIIEKIIDEIGFSDITCVIYDEVV